MSRVLYCLPDLQPIEVDTATPASSARRRLRSPCSIEANVKRQRWLPSPVLLSPTGGSPFLLPTGTSHPSLFQTPPPSQHHPQQLPGDCFGGCGGALLYPYADGLPSSGASSMASDSEYTTPVDHLDERHWYDGDAEAEDGAGDDDDDDADGELPLFAPRTVFRPLGGAPLAPGTLSAAAAAAAATVTGRTPPAPSRQSAAAPSFSIFCPIQPSLDDSGCAAAAAAASGTRSRALTPIVLAAADQWLPSDAMQCN